MAGDDKAGDSSNPASSKQDHPPSVPLGDQFNYKAPKRPTAMELDFRPPPLLPKKGGDAGKKTGGS